MKKKNQNRYFLLLMLMATALPVFSQERADTVKTWKISGNGALSFSQVSLTNWAEGGDGSVSGTFLFGLNANMKKSKHYWDNSLAVEYGLVKNESQGLRKSVDKLNFTSKYGYDIGKNNMQWETQVPIYIISAEQVNSTDSFTKELNEITLAILNNKSKHQIFYFVEDEKNVNSIVRALKDSLYEVTRNKNKLNIRW